MSSWACPLNMGATRCPETSQTNYQLTLRKVTPWQKPKISQEFCVRTHGRARTHTHTYKQRKTPILTGLYYNELKNDVFYNIT